MAELRPSRSRKAAFCASVSRTFWCPSARFTAATISRKTSAMRWARLRCSCASRSTSVSLSIIRPKASATISSVSASTSVVR